MHLHISKTQFRFYLLAMLVLLLISFVTGILIARYHLIFLLFNPDDQALVIAFDKLNQQIKDLKKQNYQFQVQQLAARQATRLLKDKVIRLDEQLDRVGKELEFYKGVVRDTRKNHDIFFQSARFDKIDQIPDVLKEKYAHMQYYHFSITLVNKYNSKFYRRGRIRIELVNTQEQIVKNSVLLNQNFKPVKHLTIRFQFFKQLEGYLFFDSRQMAERVIFHYIDRRDKNIRISYTLEDLRKTWQSKSNQDTNKTQDKAHVGS